MSVLSREAFQARVESVIAALELANDRQHPLRRIPMDLVAEAVATESGVSATDLGEIAPRRVGELLNVIMARNGDTMLFRVNDSTALDQVSPWQASSFLPHAGVARLRDGG